MNPQAVEAGDRETEVTALLRDIVFCPNVAACQGGAAEHPCAAIVRTQKVKSLAEFQVAEPWNGNLALAPVLVLSSNPSISKVEEYPTASWAFADIASFFQNRFSGRWTKGLHYLMKDGEYSVEWVRFWAAVRARVSEILRKDRRDIRMGEDFAITEAVKCKSTGETGVSEALHACVDRYLMRVLTASGAKVVLVLGDHARRAVERSLAVPPGVLSYGPVPVGDRRRLFIFLPHPNFRGPRTFGHAPYRTLLPAVHDFLDKE